jgi:hypothetical protein
MYVILFYLIEQVGDISRIRTLAFVVLLSLFLWSCLAQIDPNGDGHNSKCTTGCRDGLVCRNQTCQFVSLRNATLEK